MDAALGAPEQMAENADELTPMMSQYYELCAEYDDSLVLFQVGDFYETFCDAAEITARLLEITLTKREDSTGTYPMSGIPIDNAESYIDTLLDAGYRVAVADQVQDPDEASGVVDRAVTRVITPGTLTEDELLDTDANNFVAALAAAPEPGVDAEEDLAPENVAEYGLALLDVSTGDFYATSGDSLDVVRDEIGRFDPAEAIVGPAVPEAPFEHCMVTPYDQSAFADAAAREQLATYFGRPEATLASTVEIRACGALVAYAEYTRGGEDGELPYLNHLTRYDPREYMVLDPVALESLELFERRTVHGTDDRTLVGILDDTACALGSRKLKDWLRRPLLDTDRIDARQGAIQELTASVRTRETLHDHLRDVYDVERLISRVARGRANARDLRSLKQTLDVVPDVKSALDDVESEKLTSLRESLDELADVRDRIGRAIQQEPPAEITEGDVIKRGFDAELDDLRETERSGKAWIDDLEEQERERTGIDSLKVGHNSVHGYYIEVTNPNLDRVPDDYTRRQTLKNSERFYTPELKEREDEIIRAETRADDLEYELFCEVRREVAAESERVQALAEALAELDVLAALADVAARYGYTRPEVQEDGPIHVENGRHPVVERTEDSFVPNDTHLDDEDTFAIITGPNMSGKSTYMRQVALITILAQAGSFVPADRAELGVVDRVFTRVGASDDIAGGQSTFMIEMTELADILRGASDSSLVLLDEVGRGTSTTDGLAIAQAITEYIHDEIGATTLFATHHHELTEIATDLDGVFNLHFSATEVDEEVVFEHDVSRGAATASYGIEVARAAGVPDAVVARSRELLVEDDSEPTTVDATASTEGVAGDGGTHERNGALADHLADLEVANMTPLDALNELNRLKRRAEDRDG